MAQLVRLPLGTPTPHNELHSIESLLCFLCDFLLMLTQQMVAQVL